MPQQTISKRKQIAIGRMVIAGNINVKGAARQLRVSRNTVKKYISKYEDFIGTYPDWVLDSTYRLPVTKSEKASNPKEDELFAILPTLLKKDEINVFTVKEIWEKYLQKIPNGYKHSAFSIAFHKWCTENKVTIYQAGQVTFIPESDMVIFRQWLRSSSRRKWERATVILESSRNQLSKDIANKVGHTVHYIRKWIRAYKLLGIEGLEKMPRVVNPEIVVKRQEKIANLIRLIHESPKLHGINRTSWFLADLSATYEKVYGKSVST